MSYAKAEIKKQIPLNSQQAVLEDLQQDLEQIDQSRLAGLGITPKQLELWLHASPLL